jgi:hypothetical protein
MSKRCARFALPIVLLAAAAAPGYGAGPAAGDPAVGPFSSIPVAIWELRREGFPTVRHAWVAGSDRMLRVSWDNGASWFGFKPLYLDRERGTLMLSVRTREEVGRGETEWRSKASLTIVSDRDGRVTFLATETSPALDVWLHLVEIKEVSPDEIKVDTTPSPAESGVGGAQTDAGGRGCCVTCQQVQACDCSVCIEACHAVCCSGGCACPPC